MTSLSHARASGLVTLILTGALAGAAGAQTPEGAAAAGSATTSAAPPAARLDWFSDRLPLDVGSLVTVVIDEATSATETVDQQASNRRSLDASLSADLNGEPTIEPTAIGSNWNAQSREGGRASRSGSLYGEVTARVVELAPDGTARIEGTKQVTIDGRRQEIVVRGAVRPQDVSRNNVVYSSRLADADISYSGKKMGPKMGILGKVVSILWPF
jgi:flagellar L-ring protein precursor FlgH